MTLDERKFLDHTSTQQQLNDTHEPPADPCAAAPMLSDENNEPHPPAGQVAPGAAIDPLSSQPEPLPAEPAVFEPEVESPSPDGVEAATGFRPAEIPPGADTQPGTQADAPEEAPPPPPQSAIERSRALWKELEPDDQTDPVDHLDTDFCKNGGFLAVGASRRGRSHGHDAKYREDSFKLDHVRSWMIMAVADGAGSKPLSRVGARVACETAVEYLKRKLAVGIDLEGAKPTLRAMLSGALAHALAEIVTEATRREKDPDDFACTLLLGVYSSDPQLPVLGIAQVGDGGIAAWSQDGTCGLLSAADRSAFAGETLFITSRDAQMSWGTRARVYQFQTPPRAMVLGTDGVMDDFTPPLGKLEDFFTAIESVIESSDPGSLLLDWLNYERRGSFDDRTVVLLYPYLGDQGTA